LFISFSGKMPFYCEASRDAIPSFSDAPAPVVDTNITRALLINKYMAVPALTVGWHEPFRLIFFSSIA
jgi:hypothetical protein